MNRDEFMAVAEQARQVALTGGADPEAAVREAIAETSWLAHKRLNRLRAAVDGSYALLVVLLLWRAAELLWWLL